MNGKAPSARKSSRRLILYASGIPRLRHVEQADLGILHAVKRETRFACHCRAGVDASLLVALDGPPRERNVTRAAKRLGVGQPATSHALARLRDHFDDPPPTRARGDVGAARELTLSSATRKLLTALRLGRCLAAPVTAPEAIW
ncbi:MAG: LysR family transcriptional regulator [Myxococcales bacterium]